MQLAGKGMLENRLAEAGEVVLELANGYLSIDCLGDVIEASKVRVDRFDDTPLLLKAVVDE